MTGEGAAPPRGRRLAASGAMMAASQYICVGVGFVTVAAATRLMGAESYGVAALVLSFPSLLWSFIGMKPGAVTTRYLARFRAEGRGAEVASICRVGYGVDLGASLLVLLLCAATGWWVASHVYRLPRISGLMVLYGASLVLVSFAGTSLAVLSTWQRFRTMAAVEVFDRVLTLTLTVALLWVRPSVASFVVAASVAQATTSIVLLTVASAAMKAEGVPRWWKRGVPLPPEVRKELVSFFGWNYLLVSLSGVVGQVPLIALGRFRSPTEAGYYRLAMTLVTVGSYTEMALARVYYPVLCEQWARGARAAIRQRLRGWTLRVGLPVGGALALGTLLLPFLVPLVFGAEFRPAVRGMQLMMIGAVVGTVFFWQTSLYNAAGRFALLTKVNAGYTAVLVGVILLVASPLGFVGVAAATAAGKVACTLVLLALTRWTAEGEGVAAAAPAPAGAR